MRKRQKSLATLLKELKAAGVKEYKDETYHIVFADEFPDTEPPAAFASQSGPPTYYHK